MRKIAFFLKISCDYSCNLCIFFPWQMATVILQLCIKKNLWKFFVFFMSEKCFFLVRLQIYLSSNLFFFSSQYGPNNYYLYYSLFLRFFLMTKGHFKVISKLIFKVGLEDAHVNAFIELIYFIIVQNLFLFVCVRVCVSEFFP